MARHTVLNLLTLLGILSCVTAIDLNIFLNISDWSTQLGEEDAYLNASQLIQKHNYTAEEYSVTTDDGYILNVQRIPGNAQDSPVVLLQHGLLDSSDTWLIGSPKPEECLAFILANNGYDVWLGNSRGNKYGRHHISLDPDQADFWKFSFDELALYDLPATIDFILTKTGQRDLYYIGHSQGTTSLYAMCASLPTYNEKIRLAVSLAPVAWIPNIFSPLVRTFTLPLSVVGAAEELEIAGVYEILPNSTASIEIAQLLCSDDSEFQEVCLNLFFQLVGYDYQLMNKTRLPVYLSHLPAGISIRQLTHYAQEIKSGKFVKYDHGAVGNLVAYGSLSPPEYDVANITTPVALFYSAGDWLSTVKDVQTIIDRYTNVVYTYLVPFDNFTHLDFVWGLNASLLVYDQVVDLMTQY